MFIDSHAHLDDEKLIGREEEIVRNAQAAGVGLIVNVGCDLPSSERSVALANRFQNVYATVGMHPHDSQYYTEETGAHFCELAKNKKVVAFGEIGLDYHYDLSPRDTQKKVLADQLILADKLHLPVVFHVREAYEDFNEILKDNKKYLNNGGLLHCYGGSMELAKYYVKNYDFYFSFGGSLTFAKHKDEVLAQIPQDRILLETDSPYMTPIPLRGTPNEPKNIPITAAKMAELMGKSVKEVEQFTTANALAFYRIKI